MEHSLELSVALLSRTPAALDALLRDLPDPWTQQNEGEGTMSVYDVAGHLAYAERANWMPRLKLMLQPGAAHAFGRFDRWGHRKDSPARSLGQYLDEFARLRSDNLTELRSLRLTTEALAKTGQHPAFGAVTVSQLVATWAAHDLTHLHQISRIMAHQYREAVGPWQAYLGVMKCEGHSA